MNYIFRATPDNYQEIIRVWEASVRATHDFLPEKDILYYKELILTEYLDQVEIYYLKNDQQRIIAFIGISGTHLEMLFIHPAEREKGLGKQLICFAVKQLGTKTVDVNEQNTQAVGFYKKWGMK